MRKITLILLILSALYCATGLKAGVQTDTLAPYNKAVIWQGMEHVWTYNHRINRLGDYVGLDSAGHPFGVHFSATGIGRDSTFYSQYYTYIESPDMVFLQGSVTLQANGVESMLLTQEHTVTVPTPVWLRDKPFYRSVVNGFEIRALDKSDQVRLFKIHVDDPFYAEGTNEMNMKAHFSLVTDCNTAECAFFNNSTTYEVTIHYLIIGFDTRTTQSSESLSTLNYTWGTTIEPNISPIVKELQFAPSTYDFAFLGIKTFGFTLNEEQWLQEFYAHASLLNYRPKEGFARISLGLGFLGWRQGMKRFASARFSAKFAKYKEGWAILDMNTILFQTHRAKLRPGKSSGSMYWKGWNANPSKDDAVSRKMLKFNK